MGTRYPIHPPLSSERLKAFVALDNLTAQVPLIEIMPNGNCRIWLSYDPTRTLGTYLLVEKSGLVLRFTRYPNGECDAVIVRPADRREVSGFRKKTKPHPRSGEARGLKAVSKGKRNASTKK